MSLERMLELRCTHWGGVCKRKCLWSGACDSAWLSLIVIIKSTQSEGHFSLDKEEVQQIQRLLQNFSREEANMVVNDLLSQQGP